MKLAVCLYKYFPFGGLARDFMRIMQHTLTPGDHVDVFVMEWQGEYPEHMHVHVVPVSGITNHARLQHFIDTVRPTLQQGGYDLVIGFNKMPGLDLYYAADPCYIARAASQPLYGLLKYTGRVAFYADCEESVFGSSSNTVSLMISDVQKALFKQHYNTPEQRLISLPPGIDPNRKRPDDAEQIRMQKRRELGVQADEWVLLMVGTGYKTKGVDRSIAALAALPDSHRGKAKLHVIGDGDTKALKKQAEKLGVSEQVMFLGGRTDVPAFLLAADLLLHPARKENTGTVILEAIVAGLPVLVSDVCGYTKHVVKAQAGEVIKQPDNAALTAEQLANMLEPAALAQWSMQALEYAKTEDLYSMPEKAAQIIRRMAGENMRKNSD
jgi:UDP-glucose:(heptosyl)LPS alpha-1,3-glucosyltransferase